MRIDGVSTLRTNECCRNDLDVHLETTQNEIDQFKDILHGGNSFDARTLFGVSKERLYVYVVCWLITSIIATYDK